MISRQSRRGVVVLTLVLLAVLWISRDARREDDRPIEGLDTRLDYALSQLVFHYFDESGQPAVVMRAPRFTSDTASGLGVVSQPTLEVRHGGFLWNIIADTATVTRDRERILLSGEVRLRREGESPDQQATVDGSEVIIEVTRRVAHSRRHVELADPSGRLSGTGFTVNMRTSRFELDNEVRGLYVVE